jgi:cytochrome c biogenesis protein CcmG/thiol:disulfide interchange protein DsbE
MRRSLVLAAAVLATTVLAACGSSTDSSSPAPDYKPALQKASPPLAKLYANGDEVRDGGEDAYDEAIASVKGHPVVVNNWASWCVPCRDEFPYLQSQSAKHLDQVAFLGVDSEDSTAAAETYLEDNPLPYPSIEAPDKGDLGSWAGTTLVGYPNTLYYDADGQLVYTHQGPYTSEDDLAADIQKYALDS